MGCIIKSFYFQFWPNNFLVGTALGYIILNEMLISVILSNVVTTVIDYISQYRWMDRSIELRLIINVIYLAKVYVIVFYQAFVSIMDSKIQYPGSSEDTMTKEITQLTNVKS